MTTALLDGWDMHAAAEVPWVPGDAYLASVGSRHSDVNAVTDATYLSIFKI